MFDPILHKTDADQTTQKNEADPARSATLIRNLFNSKINDVFLTRPMSRMHYLCTKIAGNLY